MYIPRYKHKSNNVPILSKNDIDFFAEAYVKDFQPEALVTPMEFNIDLFVEEYLVLLTFGFVHNQSEAFVRKLPVLMRVYEEKSVNKNFYDNSWLVNI